MGFRFNGKLSLKVLESLQEKYELKLEKFVMKINSNAILVG